ncbi:MAG: hypothetical protein D4R64_02400 [Porphyromonadaceae bacterium]|nr:MAG: hypothetical protein D4R64_02400 [Porphyromonadaceae bacterium]
MNSIGKQARSKIGFADLYLERYGSGSAGGLPEPDPDLFLIVTIPAFKEPDLAGSLLSLLACDPPGVKWEILININYPENSGSEVVDISHQSLADAQQLSKGLARSDVRILCLWNPDMPARHAGVGLARKIVMDQAVRRFNPIGRPDGVILSFDADSRCEKGYLKTIAEFYLRNPGARTANIYFEHPLCGGFDPRIYHSIAQYELYLRYMRLAIEETGHPHSIHTVGSSFSLRSKTYIRVNGMGRDKAGEDFYFLHKCIQLKNFWEINETTVWPSVRESDRVSFGTGASIHRQLQNEATLEVYNLDSFHPLKELFGRVSQYWQPTTDNRQLEVEWETISIGLAEFMRSQNAAKRIREMHRDSASYKTFRAKFFAWFNGFMVLQYLNVMHKKYYVKKPVVHEASRLALILGISPAESAEELLVHLRDFEKGQGNRRII